MSSIRAAIDCARNGDAVGFQSNIEDALVQKLADRLDAEKIDIAQSIFGTTDNSETEGTE